MKKELKHRLPLPLILLLAGVLILCGLYRWDNKYTAALPGGNGYSVLEGDGSHVAFLVDGWEYRPGELLPPEAPFEADTAQYTYAGKYPNFSPHLGTPYGAATYRLTLENRGGARELSLYLPELLCAGRVYINGRQVGELGSLEPYRPHVRDEVYSLPAEGSIQLVIQCANYTHYYSGLYYPPAVGTPSAISRMLTVRMMVYGLLCFGSLALSLSNLALWLFSRDRQNRRLGLLCLAFSARVCYPFLRALGVPSVRPLYALEDFCGAAVLLLAILLAGELSGSAVRAYHRKLAYPAAAALCAVTVIFPLCILPYTPIFINTYGIVLSVWKLLGGAYLLFLALLGFHRNSTLGQYLLWTAGVYGLCLAVSVLTANRFEPICGAWPEEYGGFGLVLGFAALMVHRGVLLTAENTRLTLHLQEEVDRRTQAMSTLLAERRELLAELIHDVKNPLTAFQNYAELIRSGGVALDQETAGYLEALTARAEAIGERLGLLQDFSHAERGKPLLRPLRLNDFLGRFYADNRPDMELSGQSFRLEVPTEELTIAGEEETLRSALENLCYNALSFTPAEGTITLSLRREEGWAAISIADTGAGIAPADLPHIFERGFTHRPDGTGEGLGLFIVQTISSEHGGTVEVRSQPGKGSVFTLRLPLL